MLNDSGQHAYRRAQQEGDRPYGRQGSQTAQLPLKL
jgi:hypothetical protein